MKYLILGAGPAGLAFANGLKQKGETSFLVLEKESEAGGLCRSTEVDGAPLDIGGGHFLDVRRQHVNNFLFQFMPREEWDLYERDSRIVVNGYEINHPFEANIWQMELTDQVEYLKSISAAGCNSGLPMPSGFIDWIYWKLGKKIAEDYMLPYNQKMFNRELNELGTYWLEKLPNVSFEETLLSCLTKKAYGIQPGHAHFYYPRKYGYGKLWRLMADALNNKIIFNASVDCIDFESKTVRLEDGKEYRADVIITTIPWTSLKELKKMPEELIKEVHKLKYSSVEVRYYEENLDTKAQWIYYPDLRLPHHRALIRSNFCPHSRGYWTETNRQRIDMIPETDKTRFSYMNQYAYPLNTIDKPKIMEKLLTWAETKSIFGLGRWGEWQHYNSDVTVDAALCLLQKLT